VAKQVDEELTSFNQRPNQPNSLSPAIENAQEPKISRDYQRLIYISWMCVLEK